MNQALSNEVGVQPPVNTTLTAPETIPPRPSSVLHKIFIGEDALLAMGPADLHRHVRRHGLLPKCRSAHVFHGCSKRPKAMSEAMGSPRFMLIGESLQFLLVLLLTWIMSKIERRPVSVYGFRGSRRFSHFFAGLGWGVTCLSLLVLTLWKTGLLVIDSRLLFGSDILRYGAIWLLGFLVVGLLKSM